MGGDLERKSRRRRSSPSPSPSPSRDGGGSRKSGNRDDRERKKNRREDTREKKKVNKSDRSSRSGRDGKDESREKRKRERSNKHSGKIEKLSEDDYFSKNNEFAAWLKQEKRIFFSDLSSIDARKLFSSFVKEWNKGKLNSEYYEGIAKGPRTSHNWMIATGK